jgi:tRNA G18 (ribose-2'-O)-methylase SpoU
MLSAIRTNDNPQNSIRELNLCFHSLSVLIGEVVNEDNYVNSRQQYFDRDCPSHRFEVAGILDNLRSPFNVGSIFRSADSLGCKELALCGITPRPDSTKMERTAMGSTEFIPWRYYQETRNAIAHYRSVGYRILAVEKLPGAVIYWNNPAWEHAAFVFGNEEFGMTEETAALCDSILEIPQMGVKNSMNVGNAFSVIMAEGMRQNLSKP